MKQDNFYTLDSFVSEFGNELHNIKRLMNFLKVTNNKKSKKKIANTFDILERKLDNIKSAKDVDELKKHVKLKKLMNGK